MFWVNRGEMVNRRKYICLKDLRGHTPATCGQKGGSFCPLKRRGPVDPNNVLENNIEKTLCVLGMG